LLWISAVSYALQLVEVERLLKACELILVGSARKLTGSGFEEMRKHVSFDETSLPPASPNRT
jgi:hypothetical protein